MDGKEWVNKVDEWVDKEITNTAGEMAQHLKAHTVQVWVTWV